MIDFANNWQARDDMIWKAITAVNSESVKDPIAYINRMTKRYGDIFKIVVGFAYQTKNKFCYAVEREKIDDMISAKMQWKTIREHRKG